MFLQIPALMLTISVIAIGIFSAYMLYDLKQIIDGGETNYISATLALYLDLFNVFQSLLAPAAGASAATRLTRSFADRSEATGPLRGRPFPLFGDAGGLTSRVEHRDATPRAPCAGTC